MEKIKKINLKLIQENEKLRKRNRELEEKVKIPTELKHLILQMQKYAK